MLLLKKFLVISVFIISGWPSSYAQWIGIDMETTQRLNSVQFVDDNVGYACGFNDSLFRSVNGGESWQVIPGPFEGQLRKVQFFTNDSGIVVSDYPANIYTTSDGGISWSTNPIGNSSTYIVDMHFISAQIGFASGFDFFSTWYALCFKTTDGGNTWTNIFTDTFLGTYSAVYFLDQYTGFVALSTGKVRKTIDGGISWSETLIAAGIELTNITFAGNKGFIVGEDGGIYVSQDNGSTWIDESTNTNTKFNAIDFFDEDNGCIAGNDGYVLITQDGGLTWTQDNTGSSSDLMDVSMISNSDISVCGMNGTLLLKNASLSVFEKNSTALIHVYPNPFADDLMIEIPEFQQPYLIKISDLNGNSVDVSDMITPSLSNGTILLNLSGFDQGLYVVSLESGKRNQVKLARKVLKK